jgi:hypothetical protein
MRFEGKMDIEAIMWGPNGRGTDRGQALPTCERLMRIQQTPEHESNKQQRVP